MASSPKPPNPYQQAGADQQAQTGAAIGSGIINNPNEYSNYGSQTYNIAGWEQVPDATGKMTYVPRYNRTTTLSPDEQKIANMESGTRYNVGSAALGVSSRLPAYLEKGVDKTGWQAWNAGRPQGEQVDRPAIEKALMARQEEAMGKRASAEDAQLAARGLSPGTQQYGDVSDARRREMTDAQQQAYLASGQEARAWADLDNQLRQAQESSSYAERNQPLNEIAALASLSQVNMPQFSPYSRQGISASSPGDYMAQNYANSVNAASAKNQGLFGLGGAGMNMVGQGFGKGMTLATMFSDRRLKQDIVPLGVELNGVPLYEFAYKAEPNVRLCGVMADEAKALYPDAVWTHSNGFEMVDYDKLLRRH